LNQCDNVARGTCCHRRRASSGPFLPDSEFCRAFRLQIRFLRPLYGSSCKAYGLLFGLNIIGMMAANFVNARLLARVGSERLFRTGTWVLAGAGLVLAVDARFAWGGLAGLVVPVFFYMSMNGFIVANSVAGALSAFPRQAGTASSLIGALHYGSGILSAAMVGWFADGTPWTMGWIMGLSGIGSVVTAFLMQRWQAAHATRLPAGA
jgi:DHA1 family bicyclomycin/chloramphenicol resistance-like MFS transporter